MSDGESKILKAVRLEATKHGRFVRVNVGQGWTGKATRIVRDGMVAVQAGDVVVRGARVFHAGPPRGTADLLGVTRVTITQDMVGSVVGVATAIETKTAKGKQRDEQRVFERVMIRQGGMYVLARSAGDVEAALAQCSIAMPMDAIDE